MSKPYHRNLPVPYLSQRENAYIWEEREPQNLGFDDNRIPIPNPKDGQIKHNGIKKTLATSSCNITCLMMVLHYFGVTGNSADHYLRRIFNPEDDCYNVLRATLIRDNFQKKIFGIRNGETVVVNRILFPENEYLPYYAIESNQFGPAFVNTFFKQEGISCSKSFSFIDAKIEDNLSKGLPVVLFTGTTSVPLSFKEYEVPEKGENKDPLKDHLLNNTQSHDYRIDMGEGFDYDKLCEFKEDYLVNEQAIRSSNSTEQEINQARRAIDSIRNQINSYKVALSETHFVVVRGYTETEVIINDPWGEVAKDDLGNVL